MSERTWFDELTEDEIAYAYRVVLADLNHRAETIDKGIVGLSKLIESGLGKSEDK